MTSRPSLSLLEFYLDVASCAREETRSTKRYKGSEGVSFIYTIQ